MWKIPLFDIKFGKEEIEAASKVVAIRLALYGKNYTRI